MRRTDIFGLSKGKVVDEKFGDVLNLSRSKRVRHMYMFPFLKPFLDDLWTLARKGEAKVRQHEATQSQWVNFIK